MTLVINPTNREAPLRVDATGALVVAGGGGGGGGGGGDASAANQVAGNAKLDTLIARAPTPVNSAGAPLPLDFDYLPETYGYTSGALTTIVRTKGGSTWTRTLTYASGVLTAMSAWVQT